MTAPTWAVLALAVGIGLVLLAAVVLPVLAGPIGLAFSAPALGAVGVGLRMAHPVDPRRDRQPTPPADPRREEPHPVDPRRDQPQDPR